EEKVEGFADYLDPQGVPPEFLGWLASWVDLAFEPEWPVATRRALLRQAAELYRRRGAPRGRGRVVEARAGGRGRRREAHASARTTARGPGRSSTRLGWAAAARGSGATA